MKTNQFSYYLLALTVWLMALSSCKTEDVEPLVTLTVDSVFNSRISENGGSGLISATLNGKSNKEVRLNLSFSGTATIGADFSVSGMEIVIPAGQINGSIRITAIQDDLLERDETIVVQFSNPKNAILADANPLTIIISDDDVDTDNDGLSDAEDDCPLDSGAVANNGCPPGFGLIFNEVLHDPSNVNLDGDANGDGFYDQTQDEFVEIFNNTNLPQDISSFKLSDFVISSSVATVRFTFPSGTVVPPKKAVVVFGGGNPTGTFGGSIVFKVTSSAGLNMTNTGEKVLFSDASGNILQIFDTDAQADNPNESFTRNPDITGDFVRHSAAVAGKLFSPGTKSNGTPF